MVFLGRFGREAYQSVNGHLREPKPRENKDLIVSKGWAAQFLLRLDGHGATVVIVDTRIPARDAIF